RVPSGNRNSLPFHAGITRSVDPGGGSRSRTLAAGWSTTSPLSSGPATVTRTIRGVSGATARTATRRKVGGSRRRRPDGGGEPVVIAPAWHPGGRAAATRTRRTFY